MYHFSTHSTNQSSTSSHNSNTKTFLKIELSDFKKNLFTIYYIDNNSDTITKTEPNNSTIIHNILNYPSDWFFHNPNSFSENNNDNIDFIQIQTITKTKKININNTPQITTIVQFNSKHVTTRSVTKIKTNIQNYMTNFKPITKHYNLLLKKFLEKENSKNLKNLTILLLFN